jgi:CrcB protein
LFLATGILGGFTTFSTFSLDTITLWERGELASAAVYVFGSLALSFLGLWFGMAVLRR